MTSVTWRTLGTTAVLRVSDRRAEAEARAAVKREIEQIDAAASRFRADSELSAVNRAGGRRVAISPLFLEALQLALDAALASEGAVDPTLGQNLIELGYDRDLEELSRVPAAVPLDPGELAVHRIPAWRAIELWRSPPAVRIPAGVRLDLGATAKALAADRGAAAAHLTTGSGVLLSLGGDIATSGPPPADGWAVRVTEDSRATSEDGQVVTISSGGLATSSLLTRRWMDHGRARHHILDPWTGGPVRARWRTATVVASSCAGANIASTAALVLGDRAPRWLAELGVPARLTELDGRVRVLGGWPL